MKVLSRMGYERLARRSADSPYSERGGRLGTGPEQPCPGVKAQPEESPLAGEPALAPLPFLSPLLCLLHRYWERIRYMLSAFLTFPVPLALLKAVW